MQDYEFRFFQNDTMVAIHVSSIDNDSAACERARLYLEQQTEIDRVEVRCGYRFMQKITRD